MELMNNYSMEEASPTASNDFILLNPDDECRHFTFIIYVLIFGFICLFGLLGNTLSFIILQWEKKNQVATFLLQALAMADNLFLLTTGFAQISPTLSVYYNLTAYEQAAPYIRVFLWPLVHITQFNTIWMTVLIAAIRWIAVCRPLKAHKLCTMTKVRIQVALVAVFSVLYNLSHFFEFELTTGQGRPTALKMNRVYQLVYESALFCVFGFLGPLIILISLNVGLIRKLWTARQQLQGQQLPMAREEEQKNITLVMVVIVLTFVMCQTPAFTNQLLYYILDLETNYQCHKSYYYFFHLSNLLISTNSAINFIIYCLFRKQFRKQLCKFCHRS